ncbi:MAG: FliM/FliN family flagellar motor switch protein [Pseudomonadota bacterium]|nr:FliM/FliN family flagellar motor switch protein [Pseudomonadota bacterium]
MNSINSVSIELTVVLGNSVMPVHQLLKMGRGAVIELDTSENDEVQVLANNIVIARGQVVAKGDNIGISITSLTSRDDLAE